MGGTFNTHCILCSATGRVPTRHRSHYSLSLNRRRRKPDNVHCSYNTDLALKWSVCNITLRNVGQEGHPTLAYILRNGKVVDGAISHSAAQRFFLTHKSCCKTTSSKAHCDELKPGTWRTWSLALKFHFPLWQREGTLTAVQSFTFTLRFFFFFLMKTWQNVWFILSDDCQLWFLFVPEGKLLRHFIFTIISYKRN